MFLNAGRNHRYPPILLAPLDLRAEYRVTGQVLLGYVGNEAGSLGPVDKTSSGFPETASWYDIH